MADYFVHLKGVRTKNKLILRLMEALVYPNPSAYRDQLIRFSGLNNTVYSEVAMQNYNDLNSVYSVHML